MFNSSIRFLTPLLCLIPAIGMAAESQAIVSKSAYLARVQRPFVATVSLSSSSYISVALNDTGNFTIGTVAGDPSRASDDNKDLLFGHPSPGTSETILRIDGVPTSINTGGSSTIQATANSLSTTRTVGVFSVLERLTIQTSQATGNQDTVQIYFKVTNNDTGIHAVALRTQLDTLLGSNDGAPFRVPGVGEITKDKEFDNDPATPIGDIPTQALVLDSLVSPQIISLLTFRGIGFLTPDRVVFGWWPAAIGSWDYTVDPNRSFLDHNGDGIISGGSPDSDSSVMVYWGYPDINDFSLQPGESKEFAILYGVGNCSTLGSGPFNILFCAPAQIQGQSVPPSYNYTPVTATAFFTNTSGGPVSGGQASLNLTPDFILSSGYTKLHAIEGTSGSGTLGASGTSQIDWVLASNGRTLGARQLSLSVNFAGKQSTLLRPITTLTIPHLLYGEATDVEGNPISGAAVTALQGSVVAGHATTQADGTYAITGLPAGNYTIHLSKAGTPDVYVQGSITDDTSGGATGNPSTLAAGSSLEAFAYPNPVREGRAHIAVNTDSGQNADVQIFNTAGELIKTLSLGAPGPGWHNVDWSIDDVANGVYFFQVKSGSTHTRGKIAVLKRRGL